MSKTKTLIYCSLFTALIAAGAFIKIPVPVSVYDACRAAAWF